MNRREQIKLTPEEQTAFLRECRKVSLATLDKEGFPHLVAMNFVAIDGTIYMSSYGKAQKVINIRRNPKVAVMAESGKSYSQLRGIMIRGNCEILEDRETVAELMGAIRGRDTGSFKTRWSNIMHWMVWPDDPDYYAQRWNDFLSA